MQPTGNPHRRRAGRGEGFCPGYLRLIRNASRFAARGWTRLPHAAIRDLTPDWPFAGLEGIYQLPDGEARAIVLLELLGKPCAATFPVQALRRAA